MSIRTSDAAQQYIVDIIEATRHDNRISLGVSPRGSIALMKAAQVNAVFEGRDFITPDDVKKMAVPVLSHRLIIKGHAISGGSENAENTIRDILGTVRVPTEEI
jgi:MoxR-like ATPase